MKSIKLDCLWIAGCATEITTRKSRAGYMEKALGNTELYAVISIIALPLINLDPTKPYAICFTMRCWRMQKNNIAW